MAHVAEGNYFSHGLRGISWLRTFVLSGGVLLLDGISFSPVEIASLCQELPRSESIAILFARQKPSLSLSSVFPNVRNILIFEDDANEKLNSLLSYEKTSVAKSNQVLSPCEKLLSVSESYEKYLLKLKQAYRSDSPVLLLGESGSGKNHTARLIHNNSSRKDRQFCEVNVAELNHNLLASELYGTVKGAFTGAENSDGIFSQAKDGSLFLDEIAELPEEHQAKLLGVLDTNTFRKTGSAVPIAFEARFMFATDANLKKRMSEGTFRKQLYYRICVLVITVPPLRERKEDIAPLANSFAGKKNKSLSKEALEKLYTWAWPGNIRELKNCIERASCSSEESIIGAEDITFE